MKIAFHFPTLASGGVEKMRITLARELLSRGIDVDFVLCQAKGEYLDQVPRDVGVHDLRAPRTRSSLVPLVRYLKQNKPDYLVASLGPQNVVAVLAKALSGTTTKVFVTQHNALTRQANNESTQQRLIPLAYRWALPRADGVLAVSEGIADDMAAATGFPRSRINVVYNPAYTEAKDGSSSLPDWLKDKNYVLSVGRLVPQKGFDDLIRAFRKAHSKHSDLHLVILGNGPLRESLHRLASELGLGESVHMPGFASNPAAYFENARLFVLSSRYEGFGNVLVEALSFGTPIVSTDCQFGPIEILKGGEYGRLVPVDDIEMLATAIDRSLTQAHDPEYLKGRAREFSAEAIADRYLSVLRSE